MKNDELLKAFDQKGIKMQKNNQSFISKKNLTPLDSGNLIAIKGGTNGDPTYTKDTN